MKRCPASFMKAVIFRTDSRARSAENSIPPTILVQLLDWRKLFNAKVWIFDMYLMGIDAHNRSFNSSARTESHISSTTRSPAYHRPRAFSRFFVCIDQNTQPHSRTRTANCPQPIWAPECVTVTRTTSNTSTAVTATEESRQATK